MLLCDGQSEEGDEGSQCQNGEENTNNNKEPQPLEPGSPVVLKVHDMCDQSPQRQHSCVEKKNQNK